ncbi:nicotinate-nucleotide--dimethylbenzimidazole phosphoribosyltransferase, partial [Streptomyces kebangsaanensis]|uniref:nicotinate-nucleotide--dimethylbenzimidazole phosphoribosyltransferase n=1 Tax=Streptomyces kebangsaanensis TaxID=864058 RepID=UPI00093BDE6A
MTDTGQVPGEGLPESAGMVEQPGVAAHGAYAYLSESPAEDEDLLLPGSHGAWGNEVPPPAPEPVVEAVHEPGPHETSGRDSGSVDLTGVRHPDPVGPAVPAAPTPPRRPLHLGPPIPDASASPVRSLADRGPAGAPVRHPVPPTSGPEYLDVPPLREMAPQGAAPWGAQAAAATPAAPAAPPVGAGTTTAETAAPDPEPATAAQATLARLTAEAGGPGPMDGQAPDAGTAPGGAVEEAYAPEDEQAPAGAPLGPVDGQAPEDGVEPGGAAEAAPAAEAGRMSGADEAAPSGQAPDAGVVPDGGVEATYAPEGVQGPADGQVSEAGEQVPETGHAPGGEGAAAPAEEPAEVVDPDEPAHAVPVAEAEPQPGAGHEGVSTEQGPDGTAPEAAEAPAAAPIPEAGRTDAAEAPDVAQEPTGAETAAAPEVAAVPEAAEVPEAAAVPETADDAAQPPAPVAVPPAGAQAAEQPHPEAPETGLRDTAPAAHIADPAVHDPNTPEPVGDAAPEPSDPQPRPAEPEAITPGIPLQPQPGQLLGEFVPVEGSVPTTPHLAPTPQEPTATVPAPRDGDAAAVPGEEPGPEAQDADQEQKPAGPPAPAYDDAEREAVLKVIRERRDIRNGFRSDPIPHEVLLRVLEAAHTAPSVGHSQPWDFVVIRSAETRRAMHELVMRQREAYAKSLPKGRAKQFKEMKIEAILDTPVNIVVTADPTRGGRHTLGRHTQPQMAPYSSALAVENLWLAARAEGLGVGWVSFFDEREMVRALGLPEHLEAVAYLCVGYVDEFPEEPELVQAGWSKRRPLSWVVHEETYGRRALPGEDPHDLLAETVAQIRPLDAKALGEAWERQKRMTKPAGALGMLEIISAQLSGLSRQCPPPVPEPAAVAVFAGDHGVHAQGVTPWPQEVTAQMVANFLGGGAVCNAFANQVGAEVCVVDVGVAADLPATTGLLPRKVRAGTSDMTTGPAMTREEAKKAIEVGIETARDLVAAGNKALLTGEMGIANTTASAALISVFTGADPAEVTGRGTGINDETLVRKTDVVRRALELHRPDPADPIGVLAAVGGFEHAAMVGLLLGGASLRTPVILDGVSAGAAALVARAIAPEVLAACIAGHRSAEPGHVAALNKLGLRPLVDLDLCLGEGTGALLALPLVQSTARAMHEVATFDSAGVTEK